MEKVWGLLNEWINGKKSLHEFWINNMNQLITHIKYRIIKLNNRRLSQTIRLYFNRKDFYAL